MSSFISKFMVTALLTQVLAGCSTYVSQLEGQAFEPVDPAVNLASEQPSNGAIFRSGQSGLFATDQRARRVGDILTVTFNEIFAATKAPTAASSKADAFAVTLPTGLPNIVTGGFATDDSGVNGGRFNRRHKQNVFWRWQCCPVKQLYWIAGSHGHPCLPKWQYGSGWPERNYA